jgi:hypothetical protein
VPPPVSFGVGLFACSTIKTKCDCPHSPTQESDIPYHISPSSILLSAEIMGAAISAMRDSIKEADARAEEKAKQELEILQKMVVAQLDK